jgi:hypothetical protein
MLKIRRSIFETNSSSSHSLSLGGNAIKEVSEEKISIVLGDGEYGWGFCKLKNWMDKADYLGIEAYYDEGKKEILESALKMAYPNITTAYSCEGYIDHQSSGEIWGELNSVEDVYNVIFGDSVIIIDNDNH